MENYGNNQGMVMNTVEQQKLKRYKTTLCHNYEKTGTCQMSEKCHFAHGEQELRDINDPIPIRAVSLYNNKPTNSSQEYSAPKDNSSVPPGFVKNNYKTVYCKFFMQYGHCSFGERCTYAHGDQDLRPLFVPATQGQASDADQLPGDANMESNEANIDGNDPQMYNAQEAPLYNLMHDGPTKEVKKEELLMQLLDNSPDTRNQIKEVVMRLKSQNYEEAKKIVANLMGKISLIL